MSGGIDHNSVYDCSCYFADELTFVTYEKMLSAVLTGAKRTKRIIIMFPGLMEWNYIH